MMGISLITQVVLAAVFIAALVIDFFGYRMLRVKRSWPQWGLTVVVGLTAAFLAFTSVAGFVRMRAEQDENLYLTFCYLSERDYDGAQHVVDHEKLPGDHEDVLQTMIDFGRGDLDAAYFEAQRLLDDPVKDAKLAEQVKQIHGMAASALNLDSAAGTVDTGADLTQVLDTYYSILDLQEDKLLELREGYEADKIIRRGQWQDLSASEAQELVDSHLDNPEVLKSAVQYSLNRGNLEEAMERTHLLMDVGDQTEASVVLADLIAQGVLEGYPVVESEDKEAVALLKKADRLQENLSLPEASESKKQEWAAEAATLRLEAQRLGIRRMINYLQARKPLLFDWDGRYALQIAKLHLALEETEKTKEILFDLIENAGKLSEDSPIKQPLQDLYDVYSQELQTQDDQKLQSAAENLVRAQTGGIVSPSSANLNRAMAEYVASAIKYERLEVHIGRIDIEDYPTVKAFVNISGEKEGFMGRADDFTSQDFELIDTQRLIDDFNLESSREVKMDSHICLVLDVSGSMSGKPLDDSKRAAGAIIDHLEAEGQDLAIVVYSTDAILMSNLDNDKRQLHAVIRGISDGGDTNMSSGIEAGVDVLEGAEGLRSIILMSDGLDRNSPETMQAALNRANNEKVAIYTVGLGDVNDDYMRHIAESTGGKFIKTDDSTELEEIYLKLQKFIVNNYTLTYTVKGNPEVGQRTLSVSVPEYQASDDKEYSVGTEESGDFGDSYQITLVDEDQVIVGAAMPNGLSAGDLQKGVDLTITGTGFDAVSKVMVGTEELTGVELESAQVLHGSLKGDLAAGSYDLKVYMEDGRVGVRRKAVHVFRTGTTTSVRLGDNVITADVIGRVGERNFVASGNVMINNFIHSSSDLTLTAYDLPGNFEIKQSGTTWLGARGALSGNGKLYISYEQVSGKNPSNRRFASLVMGGKDYVVADGDFGIGINGNETDIDMTFHDFKIQVPNMATVDVASCKLYADRIQVSIDEINPVQIITGIKDGISGGVMSTQKEKSAADKVKKVAKRDEAFKFSLVDSSGSANFALTGSDIEIGVDVKLAVNDALQFGKFGLDEVSLKLDTLDQKYEYWKMGGKVDFSHIVRGFDGLGGSISSYFWTPDKIKVSAHLNPGIPIYNAAYIDQIGVKMEGISTAFLYSAWIPDRTKKVMFATEDLATIKPKDLVLAGTTEAQVNLFKSFKLKVPEKMTEWGTLGAIKDGEIAYNMSNPEFSVSADLEILQQKLADARISFGKNGLEAKAGAQLELAMLDSSIGGHVELGILTTFQAMQVLMEVDGHIDCGLTNFHVNGLGQVKVTAEYDGEYFAVELRQNNLISKYWYDSRNEPLLWKRFGKKTKFE